MLSQYIVYMSDTTENNGRLCNQIIRNTLVSLIAEKHDLCVNYSSKDSITKLGINLFNGTKSHCNTIQLNESNYLDVLNSGTLDCNLNPNKCYLQSKCLTDILYDYLHSDAIKSNIIDKNPFNHLYNNNDDLCIHVRLTDVSHHNPGETYYINAIKNVKFADLYIATDEKTHDIIKRIIKLYPNAKILDYDEIKTIQFASTCKNVILSHGSFSAIIGYLSFFSNVYYPEYEPGKIWYGDMFSIDSWVKCKTT